MGVVRILVTAVGLWVAALSYAQAPLTPGKPIPLPGVHGRIDHMAFDSEHNRVFVAALGSDALVVVGLNSGTIAHTITGLAEPQGIAYDPARHRLWVANGRDGNVRIYDGESFALLRTVALGDDADNIRRDPGTGQMLVGYGAGGIAIFDADANRLAAIPVSAHPESFQIESGGPRIFVNVPDAHSIAVLDQQKRQVVATWSTADARANFPMALDVENHRLFVVCRQPAELLVLDTASGRVVQKLPTVGDSDDVFFDAASKRLYVSGGEGAVSVYQQQDADHYTALAQMKTSAGARTSLFVPSLHRLFVAEREHAGQPAALAVFTTGK